MSYLPGKPLILSRLPAQDWFTTEEAAMHSGWSRSFIRRQIKSGNLTAQEFHEPGTVTSGKRARHLTARVHIDDLVLFIIRNGNGRYTEEKPFRDVATILRTWPNWMRQEMIKHLTRTLQRPES